MRRELAVVLRAWYFRRKSECGDCLNCDPDDRPHTDQDQRKSRGRTDQRRPVPAECEANCTSAAVCKDIANRCVAAGDDKILCGFNQRRQNAHCEECPTHGHTSQKQSTTKRNEKNDVKDRADAVEGST